MLKKVIASFILAFHNIRSHFFHTILSVLGIVIGVAALVAILSMIDGMEEFARDQIKKTTTLNSITVRSQMERNVNGIRIKKDSVGIITHEDFLALRSSLTLPANSFFWQIQANEISFLGDTARTATHTTAVSGLDTSFHIVAGRLLSDEDIQQAAHNAIANQALGALLAGKEDLKSILNKKIIFANKQLTLVGIAKSANSQRPELFFPVTVIPQSELKGNPPQLMIEAHEVVDVAQLKTEIIDWLKHRFGDTDDFSVTTNEFRVEQAAQGFKLFRIVMGLIVGVSVLVGGIGVMNVLLISVTERTSEIGIRKAVGAHKRDIILQFLSESITISLLGSFIGLVLGILMTMAFIPIIKMLTKMPFQAAYTWNTFFVVSLLAIVVGVVFGTYPAIRASRLDPVEAIRRE